MQLEQYRAYRKSKKKMENQYQASIIFEEDLTSNGSKIPVGIHTDCSLESVEKGDTYYDINFKSSDNHVHNKRLWQPKGSFPRTDKDGNTETLEEAKSREERETMRHIVRLLHIFLGEENLGTVSASTYDEFMAKAAAILNQKAATKKLNLKLIYDNLGVYSVFGNYPDYVEEYVQDQAPKLQYTPWELENRVTAKAKANVSQKKDDFDALLS